MKINLEDFLGILNKMRVLNSDIEKIYFKDKFLFQYEDEILIIKEFFKESLNSSFAISLDSFIEILSKLQDKEINLEVNDNININSNNIEIEFTKFENKLDFVFNLINKDFKWEDLPNNFNKGLEFTSKLIRENSQNLLSVLLIDKNKIISTDKICLIVYNLDKDLPKFFLQKRYISILLKYNIKKYYIKDKLIYFLSEDNTIICFNYIQDFEFPPYEKICLENENKIDFLNKLNVINIEINQPILYEDKLLDIEILKNKIIIKSNNKFINIKTELEKENEILDLKFKLDIEYLLIFLKSDYSSKFETFIDSNKILFTNKDIKFITGLYNE